MSMPVDYNSQLQNLVNDFESKQTPIESNQKIDKIMNFIQKYQKELSRDSLDEVQEAFKTRINELKGSSNAQSIRSVYLKLQMCNGTINKIKVALPSSGISDTESESGSDMSIE